ncbi:unnamed protein product [Rhizoctonia solani]|uniref:BTB domain-containing protein n=1 Tax=Rhizoctonia solani TaxID=456999 RepID=A0A8H3CN13_9AGAM|nr:unnamed protein product [Rhizoctonia solani]
MSNNIITSVDRSSGSAADSKAPIPKSKPPVKRHSEFFFDNTLVAIQVEDTLFNVHKYQLLKSETFSDMFKAPKAEDGEPEEGSSPECPIIMDGVNASDFVALLKVLYASHFSTHQPEPEASLIIPAFRLANMWNFADLRTFLLPLAEKHLSDIDNILFAREFDIKDWLAPAHIRLCERQEKLTTEEARKLGVDSILLVARVFYLALLQMSAVKVIAVAGATGYVGRPVVDELLKAGTFQVRVLTRKSGVDGSVVQDFKARGASVHGVSYEDEEELKDVLKGVDVVLSTLNAGGITGAQPNLLRASKKAGVKLFMPSEFGDPFEGEEEAEIFRAKRDLHKLAKELEVPITVILTGLFPDYCLVPVMGWNFEAKAVDIWGTGDEKITWTTMPDIARYVAYVLGHTPLTGLQDQVLGIQGDLKTANEVVALWEDKHKTKLQVTYHPIQELHDRIAANPGDVLGAVMRETASGRSRVPEPLSNDLYPGWNPKPIVDVL